MTSRRKRQALLEELHRAGREQSSTTVMFHAAASAQAGLGATESKTLDVLQREGAMTAGDLAHHTGLTPASVTALLDRLQHKGFVDRTRDPSDGRRVLVELRTDQLSKLSGAYTDIADGLNEIYAGYSEAQLQTVVDFLRACARVQRDATARLAGE